MPSRCTVPSFNIGLPSLPGFPGFALPDIPIFTLAIDLPCPLD